MKKLLSIFLLVSTVFCANDFIKNITSVKEAQMLPDDTIVVLRGYIIRQVDYERYTFQDSTGKITIEIDDDISTSVIVSPSTRVEILGEVDKEILGTEIDVKYVKVIDRK